MWLLPEAVHHGLGIIARFFACAVLLGRTWKIALSTPSFLISIAPPLDRFRVTRHSRVYGMALVRVVQMSMPSYSSWADLVHALW